MEQEPRNSVILAILVVAAVTFGVSTKVVFRLMLYPMQHYVFFCTQVATVVLIVLYGCLTLWAMSNAAPGEFDQSFALPKWRLAMTALFDVCAFTTHSFAASHMSGSLMVLLSKSNIPFVMLFSSLWLHTKFKWHNFIGAGVILLGVAIAVLPTVRESSATFMWALVYFLGGAFSALSSLSTEVVVRKSLNDSDKQHQQQQQQADGKQLATAGSGPKPASPQGSVNVFFVGFYVSCFQGVWAIPMLLPASKLEGLPLREMPENLGNGFLCWMTGHSSTLTENCASAPLLVTMYVLVVFGNAIIQILLIRYGTAALAALTGALVVPIGNLAFSIRAIAGDHARPLSTSDMAAVGVIVAGLVIYKAMLKDVHFTLSKSVADTEAANGAVRLLRWRRQASERTRQYGSLDDKSAAVGEGV